MYHHLKKKCKTVSSLFSTHFSKPINQKKKKKKNRKSLSKAIQHIMQFQQFFPPE